MTSDSDKPAPKPKRRPHRTQAEIFYEDYKREEAEWKTQLEAARLAAGEPPPPPPKRNGSYLSIANTMSMASQCGRRTGDGGGRPARTNQRLTPD
jgi:hypothetical protein